MSYCAGMSPSLIAIDVREACRAKRTGKAQWTYGFVSELVRRGEPLLLIADTQVPPGWDVPSVQVHRITRTGMWWHIAAVSFLRQSKDIRCYVSPTSYIVPALLGSSVRHVPVVHDLIAFRGEPHDTKATLIERLTLGRAVRFASHVLTVSESTKQDLIARYPSLDPQLITPVFAGPMRPDAPLNAPDGTTILCVATLAPRKNQERLINAFASLPEEIRQGHRLVLAGGRGWHDDAIIALARSTPGVEWVGHVEDAEYERLLGSCDAFALPSLYEGFGMQILDALQRGIPVLTSDRGSLTEVAGDAALVVDPESVESIADGLRRLLTESALRDQLRRNAPLQAKRFSWERTVDLFLKAIP